MEGIMGKSTLIGGRVTRLALKKRGERFFTIRPILFSKTDIFREDLKARLFARPRNGIAR